MNRIQVCVQSKESEDSEVDVDVGRESAVGLKNCDVGRQHNFELFLGAFQAEKSEAEATSHTFSGLELTKRK
jgi:hypothetical protein